MELLSAELVYLEFHFIISFFYIHQHIHYFNCSSQHSLSFPLFTFCYNVQYIIITTLYIDMNIVYHTLSDGKSVMSACNSLSHSMCCHHIYSYIQTSQTFPVKACLPSFNLARSTFHKNVFQRKLSLYIYL